MNRTISTLAAFACLTGCVGACSTPTVAPTAQVSYAQACAGYGAVFSTALQMRKAGKLSESQIAQVSLIDAQITPICTGPLPVGNAAAIQQITSAVTALTILEAVK